MDKLETLAERLAWAREKKELTQDALAKLAGVSQSTIGNLEAGIRDSARKIAKMAEVLGVDALWLSDGKGEPFAPTIKAVNIPPPAPRLQLVEDQEALLLHHFRSTDDDGKVSIMTTAERQRKVVLSLIVNNKT